MSRPHFVHLGYPPAREATRQQEEETTRSTAREGVLRLARLTLLTLAVGGVGWSAALAAPAPAASPDAAATARAAAPARARVAGDAALRAPVTVEIDGLRVNAAGTTEQTVGDLLKGLGLQLLPTDRLSVDPGQRLLPGMWLALDRGVPVTLVDGGLSEAGRAPRGTVGGLLRARGIVLGALDKLDQPEHAPLAPGAVVTITRVADREIVERGATDFPIRLVNDTTLEVGRQHVETPGVPGEAIRTWLIRYVDGLEASRSLIAETVIREPVAEVRRVGVRPRVIPPPPAEIEKIIRDAAAAWGADPVQLLRVAWCESRYDPNAYNPSAGDSGLFQFIPATWARNSPIAGYPGASPFDPVANANTAAMLFAMGKSNLWTCK